MKIGIVILNYLNWQDTVECIDSLSNQSFKNYEVVVVDNQSANESYTELNSRYGEKEQIHLLQSKENLGFAKGNNIGIVYCKKILGIDNILVINNDVVFTDDNYLEYLSQYEVGYDIAIIGSRIIGSDGKNQNPSSQFKAGFKAVFREFSLPLLRKYKLTALLNLARKVKRQLKRSPSITNQQSNNQITTDKPYNLHGSALFMTKNYLNEVNGLYPDTFLYYEEEILALVVDKLNLKMVYTDDIEIYHKEDQSSKLSFNNEEGIKYKMGRRSVRTGLKVSLMGIKAIKDRINHYPYVFISKHDDMTKEYQL